MTPWLHSIHIFALLSCVEGYPQYALIGFGGMVPFAALAADRAVQALRPGPEG